LKNKNYFIFGINIVPLYNIKLTYIHLKLSAVPLKNGCYKASAAVILSSGNNFSIFSIKSTKLSISLIYIF